MDYKINVTEIALATWNRKYKFQVWIKDHSFERSKYVLETLTKWFGSAEYYWGNCYLCGKK